VSVLAVELEASILPSSRVEKIMMRQVSWRAIALATALITAPVLVSAQTESIRIGKKGEIELNQPTRVGTTLLQSGHYQVQHTIAEGRHYVVFREQVRLNRRHTTTPASGPEVARVPCSVLTLGKPARFSFAYRKLGPDGMAILTEIRIADEPAGHIIALEPSSAQ
jgi:hypothetical protein